MKNFLQAHRKFLTELPQSPVVYRDFGLIVGGILLFLTILFIVSGQHHDWVLPITLVAAVLIVLAGLAPKILRPAYKAWMTLGFVLGLVVSPVVLALIYYIFFSPIALLRRLFGSEDIMVRYDTKRTSYWQSRKEIYSPEKSETLF